MSSYVFDPVQVFLLKFPTIPRVLCETVEAKDVFSTNLVKLSRQESVHFVGHSRDGRQQWFGPGVNVNTRS